MPLESLPNEVLGEIIQKLMEERHSSVYSHPILSLSRCSRYLYRASISSLYRDVIITGHEMLNLFTETIATRQELAILVSSLDLTYFDGHYGPYDRDTEGMRYLVEEIDHTDELVPPCFLSRIMSDMWGYIDCRDRNILCIGHNKPWKDCCSLEAMTQSKNEKMSFWRLTALSISLLPDLEQLSLPSFTTQQAQIDLRSFYNAILIVLIPRIQYEPPKGPMRALHNLTLEGFYACEPIQLFLKLSALQTLTLQFLIIQSSPSHAKFQENWTLTRLNITATNISCGYLVPFLKSLNVLETFNFDAHPWQLYSNEDKYNIGFGKIIEGLSHLKHILRDLRVFLGTHAQRSSDFSVLQDFSALTVFEISVWSFLPATKNAISPILGSALNHIFPRKLQSLKLNCKGISVCSLESMIQPMRRLVEEMKEVTTNLKELHLKYFPGHESHSFTSHTECELYQLYPFLAELSVECQENRITLRVS